MVQAVQAGERVVRLKGGDPLFFGRSGEELASLRAAGIEAEVINGITSGPELALDGQQCLGRCEDAAASPRPGPQAGDSRGG